MVSRALTGGSAAASDRRPPASWLDSVRVGAGRALVVIVLCHLAAFLALAPTFFPHPSGREAGGLVLLGLGQVVLMVSAWTGTMVRWPPLLAVSSLTTLGLLSAAPASASTAAAAGPLLADVWWPWQFVLPTVCYLLVGDTRRGWLFALPVLGANLAARVSVWQPSPDLPGLTEPVHVLASHAELMAYAATAWFAVQVATRAARRADQLMADRRAAARSEARDRTLALRAHEADRFVEHEVMATLHLLASDEGPGSEGRRLHAARSLRTLLSGAETASGVVVSEVTGSEVAESGQEPGSLLDALRTVATERPGEVVVLPATLDPRVPEDVRGALVAAVWAAAEAASGRGLPVEVTVDQHDLVILVRVTVPHAVSDAASDAVSDAVGSGSLLEPTAAVAELLAQAEVRPAVRALPSGAARLTLRWEPVPARGLRNRESERGGLAELLPTVWVLLVPLLLQGLLLAPLLAPLMRHPAVGVGVTGVLVASTVGLMWHGLHRRRPLRRRHTAVLALVAWGSAVVVGLNLPPGAAHPRLAWPIAVAAALPAVVALLRPVEEAVVVAAGIVVAFAVSSASSLEGGSGQAGRVDWAAWAPYLQTTLTPVAAVAVAVALRRLADRWAVGLWTTERQEAARRARFQGDLRYAERVSEALGPWAFQVRVLLDEVVARPEVLGDAWLRRRAGELERRVGLCTGFIPSVDK